MPVPTIVCRCYTCGTGTTHERTVEHDDLAQIVTDLRVCTVCGRTEDHTPLRP